MRIPQCSPDCQNCDGPCPFKLARLSESCSSSASTDSSTSSATSSTSLATSVLSENYDLIVMPMADDYAERVYPACVLFHIIDTKLSEHIPLGSASCKNAPIEFGKHRGIDIVAQCLSTEDRLILSYIHDEFMSFMESLNINLEENSAFLDQLPIPFWSRDENGIPDYDIHGTRVDSARHMESLTEDELFSVICNVPRLGDQVELVSAIFNKFHFPICYHLQTKLHLMFDLKGRRGQRPMDIVAQNIKSLVNYCFRGQASTLAPLNILSGDSKTELSNHCFGSLENFLEALVSIKGTREGAKYERSMTYLIEDVPYIISFHGVLVKDDGRKNLEIDYVCKMYVSPAYVKEEETEDHIVVTIPFLFDDYIELRYDPVAANQPSRMAMDPPFELVQDDLMVIPLSEDPTLPACIRHKALEGYNGMLTWL